MEKEKEEELEIDLGKLLRALWHRAWAIVLAMLLGGGLAFGYACYVVVPEYKANALLYVNNGSLSVGGTSISLSDLSASKTLVDTYSIILRTRLTLNDVIEQADLDYTYEQLRKMVSADAVNGTEIFEISVVSTDPKEAEMITNMLVEILPEKVAEVMDGCSVRTVDFAVVPAKPISPNVTKYTMMGILAGMFLSCGLIVLLQLLDNQIRNEDDLIQSYDLPVLAMVPNLFSEKGAKGYSYAYGNPKAKKGSEKS